MTDDVPPQPALATFRHPDLERIDEVMFDGNPDALGTIAVVQRHDGWLGWFFQCGDVALAWDGWHPNQSHPPFELLVRASSGDEMRWLASRQLVPALDGAKVVWDSYLGLVGMLVTLAPDDGDGWVPTAVAWPAVAKARIVAALPVASANTARAYADLLDSNAPPRPAQTR